MYKRLQRTLLIALLAALPATANAELNVFACEPEWAALAGELGGGLVEAYSATTALQDPHYIQARPSLIAKVRQADLVICSGAQLEIGWLPALLQKANNRNVMPGTPGYMEASSYVLRLNATTDLDRAKGDIHPQGNPHIQTNPHNIAVVARILSDRLQELDQVNSRYYDDYFEKFITAWNEAIIEWEERAVDLVGRRAIAHHRSWVYLFDWLGIEEVANLEAIPGLPPTAAHLGKLTSEFSAGGADVIVRAPYQHAKPSEWLSERTGITAIVLPLTVGGTEEATDLYSLFDDIVARLNGAINDD
ncbi:MAG: zinc ABC transporter solute-binding protein [Gammaproteobacteria bacterium]|jgi:zinc/manganese transport system substrate-binding protein|nr:zinc ABC transporter solute-binding protein [Gammaproteobacteria bacterium]